MSAARTTAPGVAGADTAVARGVPPSVTARAASSPARTTSAAGARSQRPRHGLRSTRTPDSGPRRASTASHSFGAPAAAQARSVHTCSTVAGRGRTENMA